jgi:CRISPR-associated protein Csd1
MLLDQLRQYEVRMRAEGRQPVSEGGETTSGEMPFMFAMQPVRWEVRLRADGSVRDVQPLSSGKKGKGKDQGLPLAASDLKRSGSGAKPRLLIDNAEYVLGFTKEEGQKGISRAARFHEAYVDLVRRCAEATNEPSLRAVAVFLKNYDPETFQAEHLASYTDFAPDTNVMFTVDDVNPLELPSVRQFWARQFQQSDDEEGVDTVIGECLITGIVGPVMRTEPVPMKGILGGKSTGMSFISANAPAFESYGFKQSRIAPVKFEIAEQYANGLNRLLADPNTSLKVGGVTYAFWTSEGAVPLIARTLAQPAEVLTGKWGAQVQREKKSRPEEVRSLLWSIFQGQQPGLKAEAAFYAVGLTPSGSRIAVRSHLNSTVQEAVNRLADFFAHQDIALLTEEQEGKFYGVHKLAKSMYFQKPRKGQKKLYEIDDGDDTDVTDDAKQAVDLLVQHALAGQPLPVSFLALLAGRNRAEKRVTRPRAALTKMVLLSRSWKEFDVTNAQLDALDPTRPEAAYHLGRLLAVLDDIQTSAMRGVNTTLVDRFYGSMSTTPYAVVGRVMAGTQAHLQKLRKEKPGSYVNKQRDLEEIMSALKLEDIQPKPLSTLQQALFSLGYYHQRATIAAGYREGKAARDAAKADKPNADDQNANEEISND